MLGKNRRKKVRKFFFYIHTYIVTKKWGEQNSRNNFSSKTLIVRAKNVGKKSSEKSEKKGFFIFTQISLPKSGGEKTRETIFPETQE